MTPLTRRRLLIYLAGTFVLGAIAGGAFGYGRGHQPPPKSFDREAMRVRFRDRLTSDLGLTKDQQVQLEPILQQNMDEFDAIHREHFAQIGEVMKRGRERIAAILTPEQRAKFEALEREREQRRKDDRGGPRRSDKPAGGPPPGPNKPQAGISPNCRPG
ncbi:MAG TPA: hypothetical protein PLX89_01520 [Verrucomicrobiota bacterium]|nr:hypothetical protein [Verrucomicrobiales bacterium]HRI11657.1 hypothetical protein [Verrucomicrobiota bacterium]